MRVSGLFILPADHRIPVVHFYASPAYDQVDTALDPVEAVGGGTVAAFVDPIVGAVGEVTAARARAVTAHRGGPALVAAAEMTGVLLADAHGVFGELGVGADPGATDVPGAGIAVVAGAAVFVMARRVRAAIFADIIAPVGAAAFPGAIRDAGTVLAAGAVRVTATLATSFPIPIPLSSVYRSL